MSINFKKKSNMVQCQRSETAKVRSEYFSTLLKMLFGLFGTFYPKLDQPLTLSNLQLTTQCSKLIVWSRGLLPQMVALRSTRIGFCKIARDSLGNWIFGYSDSCDFTTVMKTELQGIYNSLILAWNNDFRKVICETDSLASISLLTEPTSTWRHPHGCHLINLIHGFLARPWQVDLKHTLRKGNQCAKHGASSDVSLLIWDSCPTVISSVLLVDAMQISFARSQCLFFYFF